MRESFRLYQSQFVTFSIFLIASLAIVCLHLLFHPVRVLGMDISIFYMDEKYTLAAFFSTVTSFLVGFLALTNIGRKKKRLHLITNLTYGLFFVVLAIDEYFEVHEYTNTLIKAGVTADGAIKTMVNLSWIFPLSLIILIVFWMFFVKLKNSNREVNTPILIGMGCFFVVLIFELLGSATYGRDIYVYLIAIEEGLEMIGTSFFLLATLIENKKNEAN